MAEPRLESILRQARGFMESRILLTAAELDLFSLLAAEPLDAVTIAQRRGGELRAMTILLDALASLELLGKEDGRYRTPPDLIPLLSADSPTSVLPMLHHSAHLWHRWSRLTEIVTPETPEGRIPGGPAAFIGAMHVIGAPMADRVVKAVPLEGACRLLDVGGASGTYTMAFLRLAPEMCATLFDRPDVVPLAEERLREAGMLERVKLVGGDFSIDPLPGGHDLAYVSAIIHQNSPAQNEALFQRIFDALVPGGRIVIRDHVLSPDRTRPRAGAIFAVNMLAGTAGGNNYTFAEIEEGLTAVGFADVRLLQDGEQMDALVEARRPALRQ